MSCLEIEQEGDYYGFYNGDKQTGKHLAWAYLKNNPSQFPMLHFTDQASGREREAVLKAFRKMVAKNRDDAFYVLTFHWLKENDERSEHVKYPSKRT